MTDSMDPQDVRTVRQILTLIEKQSGIMTMGCIGTDNMPWMVSVTFGHEAPDSPMAGGASYGHGITLTEALNEIREELRL